MANFVAILSVLVRRRSTEFRKWRIFGVINWTNSVSFLSSPKQASFGAARPCSVPLAFSPQDPCVSASDLLIAIKNKKP